MKSTVLIVDDDPLDIKAVKYLLESWDYSVITARSGAEALEVCAASPVDLILSDVRMPAMSGEELAAKIKSTHPDIPVVLMTGHGDIKSAVRSIKNGAFDYLVKPPDEDELKLSVSRAIEHSSLRIQNRRLIAELSRGGIYCDRLIWISPAMSAITETIEKIAGTDSTVLITGDTGTGKELVAQTIHYRSKRAEKPLVAVNCASLSATLIESELFGHEKGAFTGAAYTRRGRFEEADGGTIFLDEISEISMELQAKLLRVLQEGEIERVGSSKKIKVDVRVIASSNRDLKVRINDGLLREDLYYRLKVIPIHVPPLKDRREDIPVLAAYFTDLYSKKYRPGNMAGISPDAVRYISTLEWKGNVRELQHAVERAVVLSNSKTISKEDFIDKTDGSSGQTDDGKLQIYLDARTREYIIEVLKRADNHKQNTADILGIDRATLYRLMKKHGIEQESLS